MGSVTKRIKRNIIQERYGIRTSINKLRMMKKQQEQEELEREKRIQSMKELVEMEKVLDEEQRRKLSKSKIEPPGEK